MIAYPYSEFDDCGQITHQFELGDHLYGFDTKLKNQYLDILQKYAENNEINYKINYQEILPAQAQLQKFRNKIFFFNAT